MAERYDYEDECSDPYTGAPSSVLDYPSDPNLSPSYHAPPATHDLEDAEEDVGALADALELNKRLKDIMSSGMEPGKMQEELNRLVGQMAMAGGVGDKDEGPSRRQVSSDSCLLPHTAPPHPARERHWELTPPLTTTGPTSATFKCHQPDEH